MKRTEKKVAELVAAVETGVSIESACSIAGIHRSTWYEWRERPEIEARLDRALAIAESRLIDSIREAGRDDWRASAWILERRYPETWSKRSELQAGGSLEVVVRRGEKLDVNSLSDSELERIAAGESPRVVLRRR
jgi:transposase